MFEDREDGNRFVMVEEWKDEDAVEGDNEREDFEAFVEVAGELLSEAVNVVKRERRD
ncbi:putative quinol monooxygenase, partial [Bacillus licheniformis]|uniref:putative quinol monooxygenase n=1 Tax=Bacillus licheniformis TaxID=1402 RepID=UPI0021B2387E